MRVTIGDPPRRLDGVLARPAGAVVGGAVVCHPHPQYGGSMDNPVVVSVARRLAGDGLVVLRFDFGGVGASQGSYSDGPEEIADVGRAVAHLARTLPAGTPITLAGYSFGAWAATQAATNVRVGHVIAIAPPLAFFEWGFVAGLAMPLTVVVGTEDRFCPPDRLAALRGGDGRPVSVVSIPGADHFLAGREDEVAAAVSGARSRALA